MIVLLSSDGVTRGVELRSGVHRALLFHASEFNAYEEKACQKPSSAL